MNEKEIMTVKQVSEYLQMDEHTVYKSQSIRRIGWTQPFWKKGCGLPALVKSLSLNPALSSIYEKTDTLNKLGLIRIVRSILRFIERDGAVQWLFKKDVIDGKGNTKHIVITQEKERGKIIYR